jgi:hypothetical protein
MPKAQSGIEKRKVTCYLIIERPSWGFLAICIYNPPKKNRGFIVLKPSLQHGFNAAIDKLI